MTTFFDGKRFAKIRLCNYMENKDVEQDFFRVCNLEFSSKKNSYIVHDVNDLIATASDFVEGAGEFFKNGPARGHRLFAEVTETIVNRYTIRS